MKALLTLLAFAALVAGCGASQRETTLRTSFVTINAAKDGFASWDQSHQAALVDAATSLSDGQAKLVAYRASRERVDAAFEVAYRAVAFAAVTEGAPLSQVIAAVEALHAAIAVLRARLDGIPAAPTASAPATAPAP